MSNKPKVAVLGANGFIGSRLVESLVLTDLAEVRPIVRSFHGMVRSARFALDCRVADGTEASSLQPHLQGCDILYNCVTGGSDTIIKNAEAVYLAAAQAGVRRLVHLSSAVVHGNSPAAGTIEETDLILEQPFEYNVNKVLAEKTLWQLAGNRAVELVVLRPMIVYGPRSGLWSARVATDLLSEGAYLVEHGTGICNTVYIDNLIHAMWLAATSEKAVNQAFFIADGERVTWRDLYQSVANAVGANLAHVRDVDRVVWQNLLRKPEKLWKSVVRQSGSMVKQLLPPLVKSLGKKFAPPILASRMRNLWEDAHENGSQRQIDSRSRLPPVDAYLATLQGCGYLLPIAKAQSYLGYQPPVNFAAGSLKAGSWLQFVFGINREEPLRRSPQSNEPIF